jgi:hypothetical protein
MRKRDTAGWPIMQAKCRTCPFGENGDLMVRAGVEERLLTFSHSQICHHPAISGKKETHLCRGGRDFQLQILARLGFLDDATDAAFERRSRDALKVKHEGNKKS